MAKKRSRGSGKVATPTAAPPAAPEPAGFGRRMGALVYDALLLIAVLFGAGAVFLGIAHGLTGLDTGLRSGDPLLLPFRLYIIGVVYLYFAGFWVRVGHTPGMLTWKLTLVRENGQPPGWLDSAVRLLSAIPSLAAAGLGWVWILLDRDRLAWHDRLSRTRIVRRPENT